MEYTTTDSAAASTEQPFLPPVPMPLPIATKIDMELQQLSSPNNQHSAASLLVGLSSDEQPTTASQQISNPLYSSNQKPTVARGPSTMSKKSQVVKNGRKKYYCKEEGCNNL